MKKPLMLAAVVLAVLAARGPLSGAARSDDEGAQTGAKPAAFQRAPDALERVSYRTRTAVGDDRLTRWKFGIDTTSMRNVTFLDAVVRTDAIVVEFVEGSAAQKAGPRLQKDLDDTLTDSERAAVRAGMGEAVRMLTYHVDAFPADAAARRKTMAFAKAMGAETIVTPLTAAPIAELDTLAQEIAIDVAVLGDPNAVAKALSGRSPRMRAAIDIGWCLEQSLLPKDALSIVKDRLGYVRLRDRSAQGAGAKNVKLGAGAGQMETFFHELNRLNLRPLVLMLDTTDVVRTPADLGAAVEAFESVVQPAYGTYVTELSRTAAPRLALVRSGPNEELLPHVIKRRNEDVARKIEAAIPPKPYATPKKARKLLVVDISPAGMSHSTVPHANHLLMAMGKKTGAWETVLDNDMNNLKYPKIKDYDGIYFNSNVGELFAEPAVREGVARFVREGGGLGGIHGTPWASRNWDEFAEIIGAKSAPHRIEQGVMKSYDPSSPIMKPFGTRPLPFREEYYRFEHDGAGRLRWDRARVLMTVDLDDPAIEPRPWDGYKRPDNIYPVTWIRKYGQGRTFYCSLGHIPETFMTPEIVGHLLAGVQFMLGDLDADTTPNPPSASVRR